MEVQRITSALKRLSESTAGRSKAGVIRQYSDLIETQILLGVRLKAITETLRNETGLNINICDVKFVLAKLRKNGKKIDVPAVEKLPAKVDEAPAPKPTPVENVDFDALCKLGKINIEGIFNKPLGLKK